MRKKCPIFGFAKFVILTAFILFVSGSSCFLSHSLPAQALTTTQKQFTTGNFQLRSSKDKQQVLTSQERTLVARANANCTPVDQARYFVSLME
uniref:Uncharacterized protein n=1 Tax=Tolypothrix bouteillei VB521301 TaxID=1479485 RepID=A0A0C1REM6_9CYAN